MNEFSLLCRILGSLYLRTPQDPILAPVFELIAAGKLADHWPLEQAELLAQLQKASTSDTLAEDYQQLFLDQHAPAPLLASAWPEGAQETEVRYFLESRGMQLSTTPANHFGQLLLAASWLEDQRETDEVAIQLQLFDSFILPWCTQLLGKIEANAQSGFYRILAAITRGALQAMIDELDEVTSQEMPE